MCLHFRIKNKSKNLFVLWNKTEAKRISFAQNNSNHVYLIWNRKTIHAKNQLINHSCVLHRLIMICNFLISLNKTRKRSTRWVWRKSLTSKKPPKTRRTIKWRKSNLLSSRILRQFIYIDTHRENVFESNKICYRT